MTGRMTPPIPTASDFLRPRPGYRHIFVFDALMVQKRIRKLCPDPRFVIKARYLSKRFIINDDGIATLVPRRGFEAWGIVLEISDIAQCGLDIALGMPGIRDRFGSLARGPAGELVSSEYYGARNNRTIGKASRVYLQPILDAVRHWGFPQSYLEEVAGWVKPAQTSTRGAR
jgi:hypothetical protein